MLVLCFGATHAQNIILKYKFTPGGLDRYKETSQMVMSSEMMPGGHQTFINESYISQKTESVNADGVGMILRVIDSTNSTMNGQPFENPATRGALGFPLRVRVAPTGRVLDVESLKDNLDQAARAVLEAFRSQLVSQPSFPPGSVRLKDSWQDSSEVTQQTQMGTLATSIRYSTTLTGSDSVSGRLVWVLKTHIRLIGSIEGGVGSVDGTGDGYVYFSGDLGKEIRSSLEINQTLNVNSPQGAVSMTMKTTTTRELLH